MSGDTRESVRQSARPVIELECGITVYPPEADGEPWRAVFTENGQRRYRQGATEALLAARLEKVTERLRADAPDMERPGADLIAHYLDPDRHPAQRRWSRKHAHTQRRLCERFAAPVIDAITCQDIKTEHMQQIVSAAPTAGEGDRVQAMISALVGAGIEGGYLTSPRLAKVHWPQCRGQRRTWRSVSVPQPVWDSTSGVSDPLRSARGHPRATRGQPARAGVPARCCHVGRGREPATRG